MNHLDDEHPHKYISNPSVTPEDAIMAAAGKLATLIKGHMTHQLSETLLDELTHLGSIFKQALAAEPEPSADPPPLPAGDTAFVRFRCSPRLTTSVESDGRITTAPASPPRPAAVTLRRSARIAAVFTRVVVPQPPRVVPPSPLPRVVPPETVATPPTYTLAHNTRSQLRPTQESMFACAGSTFSLLSPMLLSSRKFPIEMISAVLDEDTSELME